MIARIARLLLLVQALLAVGCVLLLRGSGLIAQGWLAALAAVAVIGLLRLAITANNFILATCFASETPAAHRLNPLQACRLFFGEFGATMLTSSWSMPFRGCAHKRAAPAMPGSPLPVLLVHGYACNSGYWTTMRRALHEAGISHRAVDLEPMTVSIDAYAAQLDCALELLGRESGQSRAVIVAHSMGGLAMRAYLREHGASRIAAVITLGTPHHGSGLARFAPGLNCRQMCWTGWRNRGRPSAWLQALAAQEDAALRSRFISIYSHHDNIVSPQTSSHLPGARNIEFHGIGHVALGRDQRIISRVIEEVQRIGSAVSGR